jgi:hypothetical protein
MRKIVVHLPPHANLQHASKVLSGLCGLQQLGEAKVQIGAAQWAMDHGAMLALEIEDGTQCRKVVIDLHDRSDLLDIASLDRCHVYFKRSFYVPDLVSLAASQASKVLPFGLNYPCRAFGVTAKVLSHLLRSSCSWRLRAVLGNQAVVRERIHLLRAFTTTPDARAFEVSPREAVDPVILFQTRLWEQHETEPDDAAQLNDLRANVVRALRRAFGKQFLGGVVPTPLARRRFPDCVTTEHSHKSRYVALSRRALIAVYTRGLNHSTAFKLPEYLAGSKAIVAEGLRNQTPIPLENGIHFLSFSSPEECVERCADLLRDRERADEMRALGHTYYRRDVEPRTHVRTLLDRALANTHGTFHSSTVAAAT